MAEDKLPVNEQIKLALDGRTQRWLSLKAGIAEADLSKKLKGSMEFSDEEIIRVQDVLSFTIK